MNARGFLFPTVATLALLQSGCASRRACDWVCAADAFDEAERDMSASGSESPRMRRAIEARQAAERALWTDCVASPDRVVAAIGGADAVERRRALVLAEARGYDDVSLLRAALAIYGREDDPLSRIRVLRVVGQAKPANLEALRASDFAGVKAEADPRVMSAAVNLARRVGAELVVPWIADYVARGPRWVAEGAFGMASDRGLAEGIKTELERRGATAALGLLRALEEATKAKKAKAPPEGPDPE